MLLILDSLSVEQGFRISTVSGIADFQGWNVGLQSLRFGIPQAKNSRPGDSDYFTCSEKFKTTMTCCTSRVSPLLKRRDTQSDYILFQKHFLRGGIPFYPHLIQTKGEPTKLVCYCLQSFVYLRHFQTYHARARSDRGPRKKPSIYRDFNRGTQRLFSLKYLFGEANIA